ncbi:MAG: LamG domain-containing protein [Verrucomicrobia bacterium]|nr:LamG domain-containing protein [Verrucomicrobiota bacterium]
MKTMKQLFSILILTIGGLFQTQAQDEFTNGLVAYYPFNGNANDASGNGNNATPAGNYQFLTNGLSGGAIRIIGDNSQYYAGGGHVILPTFSSTLNSGFSLSLWVRDEVPGGGAVGNEAYITFQPQNVYPHCQIFLLNEGSPPKLGFEIHSGASAATLDKPIDMGTYPNSWKHLALVSGPGKFACYLNGTKIYETNVFYTNIFPAPYNALGRHWWDTGSSARMSVTYDNVRIYGRALSDSEVQQLYAYEVSNLTNGLLAYYPFNGNANDESGNGNNASISGAVLTTDRFGEANKAFYFNGAGNRLSASITGIPLGNSPRSITAWIKPDGDTHPVNAVIAYGIGDCGGKMFGLSYSKYLGGTPGYDNLGFWGGCQDYSANLFTPPNQWSFVAVTYDGSNIRLFANGLSETDAIGTLSTQNSHLWIGAETLSDGGDFRDFFKGSIDQVRVYNRALLDTEVQKLYASESGPRVDLIKAVKPSFSGLSIGTNYQLQVSGNLNSWTNQGSAFTATNSSMFYPQYFDVDNWGSLFFRLQVSP